MEIQAPAKLNLFLYVVGRRDDGYHELNSLMCCVGLHDTLLLRMGGDRCTMTCSDPDLPCDDSNLVLNAVRIFNTELALKTRIEPLNLSLHLTKRIPVGAGLGGGSSDAAAVLNGLNRHYGDCFSRSELEGMGLEIGADVPFFIGGKPSIATGVGEVLTPYTELTPWAAVIVYPGFGISTAQVFKNLNLGLTKGKKNLRYSPFKQGNLDNPHHLWNDLETVAVNQFPVIEGIKRLLLNQGSKVALMTGSGSAVFGLFTDMPSARNAADTINKQPQWRVFVTQLVC